MVAKNIFANVGSLGLRLLQRRLSQIKYRIVGNPLLRFVGRRVRTFNLIDDLNGESLAIDIGLNLPVQGYTSSGTCRCLVSYSL